MGTDTICGDGSVMIVSSCMFICYETDQRCQELKCSVLHVNVCVQSAKQVYLTVCDHTLVDQISCLVHVVAKALCDLCYTHQGTVVCTRCQLFKTCS